VERIYGVKGQSLSQSFQSQQKIMGTQPQKVIRSSLAFAVAGMAALTIHILFAHLGPTGLRLWYACVSIGVVTGCAAALIGYLLAYWRGWDHFQVAAFLLLFSLVWGLIDVMLYHSGYLLFFTIPLLFMLQRLLEYILWGYFWAGFEVSLLVFACMFGLGIGLDMLRMQVGGPTPFWPYSLAYLFPHISMIVVKARLDARNRPLNPV
jgi:hypothetical protein